MKVTAYGLLLFFIGLNISLYLINETNVLPDYEIAPYEEPEGISERLLFLDISTDMLFMAAVNLTVATIIGKLTGNLIFGGTVAIVMLALEALFPIVRWILFGFPTFLASIQVPLAIRLAIQALMAAVWFWFILGLLGQRSSWEQ